MGYPAFLSLKNERTPPKLLKAYINEKKTRNKPIGLGVWRNELRFDPFPSPEPGSPAQEKIIHWNGEARPLAMVPVALVSLLLGFHGLRLRDGNVERRGPAGWGLGPLPLGKRLDHVQHLRSCWELVENPGC